MAGSTAHSNCSPALQLLQTNMMWDVHTHLFWPGCSAGDLSPTYHVPALGPQYTPASSVTKYTNPHVSDGRRAPTSMRLQNKRFPRDRSLAQRGLANSVHTSVLARLPMGWPFSLRRTAEFRRYWT